MIAWQIRYGTENDIEACQRVARPYRKELPFITRAQLRQSIGKRELFVAEVSGQVIGFVRWHSRRDGWQTVYDLAVRQDYLGQGVGRALLYSVKAPLRLKCTQDNTVANRFYANAGMQLSGVEQGKKRALNVWEMRVLCALVFGGNKKAPEWSRKSGMAYGVQNEDAAAAWPFMLDIHWDKYDWDEYMRLVKDYRPVMAMAADYERPSQRRELYRQIRALKAAGVMRVMVCPKFDGAVYHIPSWCIVAVSVPSQFAGFLPKDLTEYKGRKIHLLGGTPADQIDLIPKIAGVGGVVISLDGNSHETSAKKGSHFESGMWRRKAGQPASYEQTIIYSGKRIVMEVNAAGLVKQLSLGFGEAA
jgi:GNAT superfamily N-acetyltransferase